MHIFLLQIAISHMITTMEKSFEILLSIVFRILISTIICDSVIGKHLYPLK